MQKTLQPARLFLCAIVLYGPSIFATNYVILDFETPDNGFNPTIRKGYPLWSLPPVFENMHGSGNHFEISEKSHGGLYSLKFTYEAKNNFCNTCGSKTLAHKKGIDGANYFIAQSGEDLSKKHYPEKFRNPKKPDKGTFKPHGPHASPDKILYNKSRGYSQWQVTSVTDGYATNDKLTLKLLKPGIGDHLNIKPVFNGNDKVAITRQCGTDGIIGIVGGKPDLTRRSDCNGAILWFGNISPNLQASGTSIFRRIYLMADINTPPSGHKLNYARFLRGAGRGLAREIYTIAANRKGRLELHLTGFGKMGGQGRYRPGTDKFSNLPDDAYFEPGIWYYLEQEYKTESHTIKTHINDKGTVIVDSYKGNGDGEYRLWFAKSGEEIDKPLLEVKNLRLPPILGGAGTHMSLWGNVGHHSDSYGSWYMDDIKISSEKIGPIVKQP